MCLVRCISFKAAIAMYRLLTCCQCVRKYLEIMMKKLHLVTYVVFAFLVACHKEEPVVKEAAKLEVTQALRKDVFITKEYVSQIHAFKRIELRAMERGYIQNIFVDEGQNLALGQPMFKIMPNLYEVELQKAKAEATAVEIEYQNTKALTEKNIISPNELSVLKAKLDKANAEVKLAATHLGFTNLNAPFAGIMDHLEVRNGSLVEEGDLLTTISDISKIWVYFNVPEAEYLDFKTHKDSQVPMEVELKMANDQIFNQVGRVETIEADFDNKTGNIEFRATFPNPDKILRHGETGNILMKIPFKNAMVIPQKATFEILDKVYVYVVNKNHVLEQRPITIAAEQPHVFIVKDGLKDSDQILVEGLRKVQNGQKVDINFRSPEAILSEMNYHAE